MARYATRTSASPATAWALLARPARWPEWAPHVRGAWGLGAPEVQEGRRGAARLLGVLPVPARITSVDPGRSWAWRVGAGPAAFEMDHVLEPLEGGGSEVAVVLRARGPAQAALDATYGPLVRRLVARLGRVAALEDAACPSPPAR